MTENEKPKVAIYKKIAMVAAEIMNLEKDMTVGSGSYSYKAVSDVQVTLAVKQAERNHNVLSIPFKQELISSSIEKTLNSKGNESLTHVDTIKMWVKIIDLDTGEFEIVESFGKGIDSSDKGLGKASTYARKYALLNAYKIATGEDPDAEKSSTMNAALTIEQKHKAVIDYMNMNEESRLKVLEHFSCQEIEDLTKKELDTVYKTWKAKRLI